MCVVSRACNHIEHVISHCIDRMGFSYDRRWKCQRGLRVERGVDPPTDQYFCEDADPSAPLWMLNTQLQTISRSSMLHLYPLFG